MIAKYFYLALAICLSWATSILAATYYVKIQYPLASDPILNIGEVTAYSGTTALSASVCSLSSIYNDGGYYAPGYCCDNNFNNFCSSLSDPNAYFTASFTSQFDKVVVTNRQDCCQYRIVGATFSIYDDSGKVWYQTTFAAAQSSYTFSGLTFTSTPTVVPTPTPTTTPSAKPTATPTVSPTSNPTANPSQYPTANPTVTPSAGPTVDPTAAPSMSPTCNPTADPSVAPTAIPSELPTVFPTCEPSSVPSISPSPLPTSSPVADPTSYPTLHPTAVPTQLPTPKKGILGVDYGRAASLSSFEMGCLHNENHISFMVTRGYMTWRSPSVGVQSKVDPNVCKHLRLTSNSSVSAQGIYVMARPFDGLSAYDPLRELKYKLSADCPEFVSYHKLFTSNFRVWLGVTLHSSFENNGWFTDVGRNRKWFESLVGYCKRYFKADHCGVWTSAAAWETIFGEVSYYNSTVMKDLALWYSLPSDGSPNFRDYDVGGIQIGGWTTPLMKQFRAPSEMCGVRVGVNWVKEE